MTWPLAQRGLSFYACTIACHTSFEMASPEVSPCASLCRVSLPWGLAAPWLSPSPAPPREGPRWHLWVGWAGVNCPSPPWLPGVLYLVSPSSTGTLAAHPFPAPPPPGFGQVVLPAFDSLLRSMSPSLVEPTPGGSQAGTGPEVSSVRSFVPSAPLSGVPPRPVPAQQAVPRDTVPTVTGWDQAGQAGPQVPTRRWRPRPPPLARGSLWIRRKLKVLSFPREPFPSGTNRGTMLR
jgi:hypothetical protein